MTCTAIVAELKSLGSENIRQIFIRHGALEPVFGVRVEDLKKLQKKIKKNHALSLALFDTGIYDAQYLAGLIADETKMGKQDLQNWASHARGHGIIEYTVPWVAAETEFGYDLGKEWIEASSESLQAAGWNTLSNWVGLTQDEELDMRELKHFLKRIKKEIATAGNRVKYAMNNFIIATGCSVPELTEEAMHTAGAIGTVAVDMNGTACKVPYAPDYIQKAAQKGVIGKKKKMARC